MQNNLEPHKNIEPKQHLSANKKQEQQFKLVGTIRLKRGLFLWQYNPSSDTVEKLELQGTVNLNFENGEPEKELKTVGNPELILVEAINKKSALKKGRKGVDVREKNNKEYLNIKPF